MQCREKGPSSQQGRPAIKANLLPVLNPLLRCSLQLATPLLPSPGATMLAAASTWGRTLAGPQTLQRPQAALQTRRARRQGRQAPGRRVSHLVAAAAQPTSSSGAGEEDTGRDFASSLALMVMGVSSRN